MIRVGFLGDFSKEWVGGINYVKNLLYALQVNPENQISPVIFVAKGTDPGIVSSLSPYAEIIETSLLTRKKLNWFIWRVSKKLFNTDLWLEIVLKKHKISVFSHSHLYRVFFSKTVNWIPDFQHLRLPQMFSSAEIVARDNSFYKTIRYSDLVVLSSEDARKDFKTFAPKFLDKVRILRFVAQPKRTLLLSNPLKEEETLKKHSLSGPFFYLPNQFWKHKNHKVVFDAVELLKHKGVEVTLACSGQVNDYRNNDHISILKKQIQDHSLDIRLLGLIDYDDVITLMKRSRAVINPSLFEGWSSTVEECKAIGKQVILSDIPVHREQNPLGGKYFNLASPQQLADLMEAVLAAPESPIQTTDLEELTKNFAQTFQEVVFDVLGKAKTQANPNT